MRPHRHHRHGHWRPSPEQRRQWWLNHYIGARLHRRIFVGFGFSILFSAGVGWLVYRAADPYEHATAIAVGVSVFLMWFSAGGVARRLTRPLVQLVKVTRDIGNGKLDSRMKLSPFDRGEVGVLAGSVNDMAERIEKQLADQRELLAAVSHELRTPLGHMRVLVDTAREDPNNAAPLEEIEQEILQVDRLVDQLLATSRLDFGQLEAREIDAAELAVRALERTGTDASHLDVDLDDPKFEGDPTLVLAALTNLIQNARHHGGGVARVIVSRENDQLRFEVWDEGPGFDADESARVFESFFRGERRAGGSLGLGLSLVQRIARAHRGEAWASNRETGGAKVGFAVAAK